MASFVIPKTVCGVGVCVCVPLPPCITPPSGRGPGESKCQRQKVRFWGGLCDKLMCPCVRVYVRACVRACLRAGVCVRVCSRVFVACARAPPTPPPSPPQMRAAGVQHRGWCY